MSVSYHSRVVFVSACLALSACGSVPKYPAPPPTQLVPFNAEEVRFAQGTGTASIEGQAFLKTRGGDVKYGAGNTVLLIPYSAHSFDWYARMTAGRGKNPGLLDDRLAALIRKTTSGGDGRFRFENVPPGSYLILTSVTWEVPGSYSGPQGGYLGSPVTAVDGKAASIIITR